MSDDAAPTLEDRIMDLEIRLSFLDKTMEDLDGVVRSVADEMVRVRKAVLELEGKVQALDAPNEGAQGMQYEKPPHY